MDDIKMSFARYGCLKDVFCTLWMSKRHLCLLWISKWCFCPFWNKFNKKRFFFLLLFWFLSHEMLKLKLCFFKVLGNGLRLGSRLVCNQFRVQTLVSAQCLTFHCESEPRIFISAMFLYCVHNVSI